MTSSGLVVLTGGSSGLGLAMATALAVQGQKVLSLARGTNDASPRDEFVNLAQNGGLDTTEKAAAKVFAYLARPDFGDQPVAEVRQA